MFRKLLVGAILFLSGCTAPSNFNSDIQSAGRRVLLPSVGQEEVVEELEREYPQQLGKAERTLLKQLDLIGLLYFQKKDELERYKKKHQI